MTEHEAKWIALERVRESLTMEFTPEFIKMFKQPSDAYFTFWCAGIRFKIVGSNSVNMTCLVKRIGGRPFTEDEALEGLIRMGASE